MIENNRIYLRKLNPNDLPNLSAILQDSETMYAYESTFSDQQVLSWLEWNLSSYKDHGLGLWAIIDKSTKQFVGQCGLVYSEVAGESLLEVGYLVNRQHWNKGYAKEASKLSIEYARNQLQADKICSIIRDTNIPSQKVAESNGMTNIKTFNKDYSGTPVKHFVYGLNLNKPSA